MKKYNNIYIKNKGILIGVFDENELKIDIDKKVLEDYKEQYPEYGYTNTKIIKEKGIKKLAIYICSAKDFKI